MRWIRNPVWLRVIGVRIPPPFDKTLHLQGLVLGFTTEHSETFDPVGLELA